MNNKNLKKCILTIIVLFNISLTGCTSPNINLRQHQFRYDTESVNVALDKQNNLHVVWQERIKEEIIVYYTKLDKFGNDIINDKKIYSMRIPRKIHKDPDIAIDSNNNPHIIFIINNNLFYTKLDNNGNNVRDPIQLTEYNTSTDGDILIDLNNNLHIVWTDWRSGKAQIYYTKLNNFGKILIDQKILGQNYSYDPSITINSEGNIFIFWYYEWINEGVWETTRHRQVYCIKMNVNGEILERINLEILGNCYKQSSIEVCINSKDQVGIVWTLDDKLKYFPLELLYEEKKSPKKVNKEFIKENNDLYYLKFTEFESHQNFLIKINITKQELGRSSGKIFINRNGCDYKELGSWSFGFKKHQDILTLRYDVTDYIKSNGLYKILFEKDEGIANPEIQNIQIISNPQPINHEYGCILASKIVVEPAVIVDAEDNNNFVWYDAVGIDSELYYLKCDYKGNIIINKKQVTFAIGRSYDPAIIIDSKSNGYIIWLDDRKGENGIYFMKIDRNCNKTISDKRISDKRIIQTETSKKTQKKVDNIFAIIMENLKYIILFIFLILFISVIYRIAIRKGEVKK